MTEVPDQPQDFHARKARTFVEITGVVLALILIVLYLGYFRLKSKPQLTITEYSINGMVVAVNPEDKRVDIRIPILSATPSGTTVSYEIKSADVSDNTVLVKSELIDGKLNFSPAKFQEITPGAQVIIYTSVNPQNSPKLSAVRLEIVKRNK